MKRLIVAVAALGFGISAYAAGMADPASTSFEEGWYEATNTLAFFNTSLTAENEGATWSMDLDEAADIAVTAYAPGEAYCLSRPDKFYYDSQNSYLKFNTALGKTITRTLAGPLMPDAYVDMLVKFTVCDTAPEITGSDNKLAVWILGKDSEGDVPGSTNLIVTAGCITNSLGDYVQSNFLCKTTANVADGGWHRLTIKAIADIGQLASVPGFVVFVDTLPVYSTVDTISGLELSNVAVPFNQQRQLFPSLSRITAINGVAMSGQGAIDDISFTYLDPDFPQITRIAPGSYGLFIYYTAAEALAAAGKYEATPPTVVADALNTAQVSIDDYRNRFEAMPVYDPFADKYAIAIVMNDTTTNTLASNVCEAARSIPLGDLASGAGSSTVNVQTLPGFYYWVEYKDTLAGQWLKAEHVLCNSHTNRLEVPKAGAGSGFYRVCADCIPPAE